jgi:hypothetical protein
MGNFPPASQAGRLAGPVFFVYVFSLLMILIFVLLVHRGKLYYFFLFYVNVFFLCISNCLYIC